MSLTLLLSILIFSFCGGCSDSTSNDDLDELGTVTFEVSGALEGDKEGMADFYSMSAYSLYTWEISTHDFNPQSFSLQFQRTSQSEIENPEPGTYSIGGGPDDYLAIFTDTEAGFADAVEYSTFSEGTGGTLEITHSSDDLIRGTFSFTASSEGGETVTITNGQFEAKPRQFD
ncbi:DUF6252 family protein [Rhodohalobacter halophilus]|uniref:DUF6252 family protein n=1 Tax=Rhodohalobacter halophilus TaxID=1812810 RepID=UPI00114CB0AA|nr:DUF6252 family protein [Rhodohalobacter halophilus]